MESLALQICVKYPIVGKSDWECGSEWDVQIINTKNKLNNKKKESKGSCI